jgi:NADPH2:quinone reductase
VRTDGEWSREARELSDGGVDIVIDPVGGDRFIDTLRALRKGGQLIVIGFAGGSIPEVRVNRLLLNATLPLERAADALAVLDERRASGKVVLKA